MIIIHLKTGKKLEFNIPNEDKLIAAWHAMGGEPKYADRKFKFTPKDGEPQVTLRIGDIKSCISVTDVSFENVTAPTQEVPDGSHVS